MKGNIICKLRTIAVSMSGEECDKAIDDLKKSEFGMKSYRNTWKHTGYQLRKSIFLFY